MADISLPIPTFDLQANWLVLHVTSRPCAAALPARLSGGDAGELVSGYARARLALNASAGRVEVSGQQAEEETAAAGGETGAAPSLSSSASSSSSSSAAATTPPLRLNISRGAARRALLARRSADLAQQARDCNLPRRPLPLLAPDLR